MQKSPQLFSVFSTYPKLLVALSTKKDGQMKLGYQNGPNSQVLKKRKNFFETFSITPNQVVTAKLVHKNNVAIVTQKDTGKFMDATDGLITNQKNVFLAITVADCLPIFLYDPTQEVTCLLHAGWRGLSANIIVKAVVTMQKTFSSKTDNIFAGIGPGIDVCHFAVKEDVLNKFRNYTNVTRQKENTIFLNLKHIAKQQLLQNGIEENHIEINPLCTFCEKDTFFSYRRDKPSYVSSMLAIFGMSS